MSNKNQIKNRHKGRGNTWLKIKNDTNAYQKILNIISSVDSKKIVSYFEKAGYAWVRFSKVNKDDTGMYEIRYRGSKLDHPDCTINLEWKEINSFELLGNTPVKLYLETKESKKEVKTNDNKEVITIVKESVKSKRNIEDNKACIKERIDSARNVKPVRSTQKELDVWNSWCRINGIFNSEEEI
jgi:hypothetical protein